MPEQKTMTYEDAVEFAKGLAEQFGEFVTVYGEGENFAISEVYNPNDTMETCLYLEGQALRASRECLHKYFRFDKTKWTVQFREVTFTSTSLVECLAKVIPKEPGWFTDGKFHPLDLKTCRCGTKPLLMAKHDKKGNVQGTILCPKCGRKSEEALYLGDVVENFNELN